MLRASFGVLALTACGIKTAPRNQFEALAPYIESKNVLVASLSNFRDPVATLIADHQISHIKAVCNLIGMTAPAPTSTTDDPVKLLNKVITMSDEIVQTSIDDEVRRLLLLIGASDAVHYELLGRES